MHLALHRFGCLLANCPLLLLLPLHRLLPRRILRLTLRRSLTLHRLLPRRILGFTLRRSLALHRLLTDIHFSRRSIPLNYRNFHTIRID